MAKAIMIQGTMSSVGKSLITAGLLRIFKEDGYQVAPFKSQNMALNSYITREGLEMGRAQAMQAEACGLEPMACMNPILLKPVTDMGSQVIVNGRVVGDMKAAEYFKKKKEYKKDIMAAYEKVSEKKDIVVIEGAGSPAEINLKQNDIVNMGMAKMADAKVLLVGDIDRGGVFAQLCGTLMLLEEEEKKRIRGLIINKFRGDKDILKPGLSMLEKRCTKPVFGVIPYIHVDIEEEDSLAFDLNKKTVTAILDIGVVRLPHISNFTDFDVWKMAGDVSVRYITGIKDMGNPDLLIIPGTKNTMGDLVWLREAGLEAAIKQRANRGELIFGICGGYQMLGRKLYDPYGIETGGQMEGIGLLPGETIFTKEKVCTKVTGYISEKLEGEFKELRGTFIEGYEIHMGVTRILKEIGNFSDIVIEKYSKDGKPAKEKKDGMVLGNVGGTYIHGIFDSDGMRTKVRDILLKRKGIEDEKTSIGISYGKYKEQQYQILARQLRENLDMNKIYGIL